MQSRSLARNTNLVVAKSLVWPDRFHEPPVASGNLWKVRTGRWVELDFVGKERGYLIANHWWTESATLAGAFIDAIEKPILILEVFK
jgi:hypothetical protein